MSETKSSRSIGQPVTIDQLPSSVLQSLADMPASPSYVVALSGGLDSIVLLYSVHAYLKSYRPSASLSAIHVHHGLSENANDWASLCQEVCHELNLELVVAKVEVKAQGKGIEAAARQERYNQFDKHVEEDCILLQGHHQNDQAETILWRLFKGSVASLVTGMPQSRELARGALYRPFLTLPKSVLEDFARSCGLTWVDDESNVDQRFDRNFIRHSVMPTIERRWASIGKNIVRFGQSLQAFRGEQDLWCGHALRQLGKKDDPNCISIEGLKEYEETLQKTILRFWFDQQAGAQPSHPTFERIWQEGLLSSHAFKAEIAWGEVCLRSYQGYLYLLARSALEPESLLKHALASEFEFSSSWFAEARTMAGYNIVLDLGCALTDSIAKGAVLIKVPAEGSAIRIALRSGGERFCLPGRDHSTSVKQILQTASIPPWQRDRVRLIYVNGDIAYLGFGSGSVLDLYADGWRAESGAPGLMFSPSLSLHSSQI